ncbi:MAG TPA: BrnT family toxin [Terracidiphilus sp.]|jgi:hypothetical protein|nr:BrnT family toxin [Terracidiphilus sp.]
MSEFGGVDRVSIDGLDFEWHPDKANSNLKKHGVSFEEAKTILGDPRALIVPDQEHSEAEFRFLSIGRSDSGRLITMCFTERENRIRIISARLSERWEGREYETGNE